MSPVHLPAVTEVEPCVRRELTFPDWRSGAPPSMLTGPEILEPEGVLETPTSASRMRRSPA
jgi:hypothetical protein